MHDKLIRANRVALHVMALFAFCLLATGMLVGCGEKELPTKMPAKIASTKNQWMWDESDSGHENKLFFNGPTQKKFIGDNVNVYLESGELHYRGGIKNDRLIGKGIFYDYSNRHTPDCYLDNVTEVVDGKREGQRIRLWRNGKLNSKATYRNGRLDGIYLEYDENEKVLVEQEYDDGWCERLLMRYPDGKVLCEGKAVKRLWLSSHDSVFEGTTFYENGTKEFEGRFVGGPSGDGIEPLKSVEFHGKGELFNESGEVIQKGKWNRGQFVE